jgi:hypothetical protein
VGFDKKTTAWWDTIDDNLYDSYGGSSDLWETTWTAEDINNPGFGVDIAVENIGSTNTAYIDHIRIKVHYGRQMIEMIAPGETREMNFDIDLPDESLSNLLYRKIKYFESGTGKLYNCYVDNLEIDGIYIASPLNQTYTVIGNTITCGSDEIYLDIIPEEPLVWRAYSLNGAEDITFSGNIVGIPLPDKNGIYSIQVFGNNSIGTMFQSEIRYFTIKYPIEIIHPEESVSEKYHEISTDNEYSFNNDIPGSDPSGWTVIDHVDKGSIEVVENMNDQEKPVEIRNYGVDYEISMSTVFSDSYTDANITFSLLRESNNDKDTIIITLLCDDGSMVYTIENGDLYYGLYSSKTLLESGIIKNNTWQLFTIFFNATEGCRIFNDDNLYVPDGLDYAPFSIGTPSEITGFKIAAKYDSSNPKNYGFWIDDISVQKIVSGFMLDTVTHLTNLQYSFDGQSKKSFNNLDTFSFPSVGEHSIVIYGTDTYGNEFQSENRTFSSGETYNRYEYIKAIDTPDQWSEFEFIHGNGETIGDLADIDDEYCIIKPRLTTGYSSYETVRPDGDVSTGGWVVTPNLWDKVSFQYAEYGPSG